MACPPSDSNTTAPTGTTSQHKLKNSGHWRSKIALICGRRRASTIAPTTTTTTMRTSRSSATWGTDERMWVKRRPADEPDAQFTPALSVASISNPSGTSNTTSATADATMRRHGNASRAGGRRARAPAPTGTSAAQKLLYAANAVTTVYAVQQKRDGVSIRWIPRTKKKQDAVTSSSASE